LGSAPLRVALAESGAAGGDHLADVDAVQLLGEAAAVPGPLEHGLHDGPQGELVARRDQVDGRTQE
jgi:hypothetical protein